MEFSSLYKCRSLVHYINVKSSLTHDHMKRMSFFPVEGIEGVRIEP
uniref:Uncharacterized protein n=1 Tax=Arundo donax TaxID=35708 RepID=A0A0A9HF93_ARUDO